MIDFLSFAAAMLKALAAPMVLDEKKSADWRCGGDEKLGGALFDGNKLDAVAQGGRRRADGGEGSWAELHINNNKQVVRAGVDERIIDGNDALDGMRNEKPDEKNDVAYNDVDLDKQLWWVIFCMNDGESDMLEEVEHIGGMYIEETKHEGTEEGKHA